jgi:hypothetical protein
MSFWTLADRQRSEGPLCARSCRSPSWPRDAGIRPTSIVQLKSQYRTVRDQASETPHQFRTRNNLIRTQRTRSKSNKYAAKSTELIDILPLITVWLQVRVLPGPPAFAREASKACRAEANGEGGPLGPRATARQAMQHPCGSPHQMKHNARRTRRLTEAEAIPAASRIYVCWTSECNALTAASRLSTGTNRLTECGDNTYLSGTIP